MTPSAPYQYKDRLFKDIFSDKRRLLSLYNSLNNSNYTNPDDLETKTIDSILYVTMKNDLSFLIDDQMHLYEQQSSYNPNMPLRGLMYFAELYQIHLTELDKDIYSRTLVRLPTPKFVVFYNGMDKSNVPDVTELHLSDAFIKEDKSGKFEWTATMLNINAGHNGELLQKCKELGAYSAYISRVHSNIAKGMDRDTAINEAVEFAIKENLLDGYFTRKKMEVLNMSLHEFDKDEYDRHRREEGRQEGIQEGMQKGRQEGILQKAISTAKAMLSRQLDTDIVSECTGLSIAEVAQLQAAL